MHKEEGSVKKIFENPEIEIMILGAQDVITTSGARGEANDSRFNETPDW